LFRKHWRSVGGVRADTWFRSEIYAGQYKVNPIATILALKMMLDWLDEKEKSVRLENAVAAVIKEGKMRTYDMGGNASTLDMAKEITRKL